MGSIKQVSHKRASLNSQYIKAKKQLEVELKAKDEWFCFFSGIPFSDEATWKDVTWHHNAHRENELLVDKRFLRPVLDQYHTGSEGFHNIPLSKLKDLWWFEGYKKRLRNMSEEFYESLISKIERL